MRIKLVFLTILLVVLTACSAKEPKYTPLPTPSTKYVVKNYQTGASTKCTLDVELPYIISEEDIKVIAEYIHDNEGLGCLPLFIFYFLPEQTPGKDIAWAYSHFNPQLELKINGLTLESKATLEVNSGSDESIIGVWLDTGVLPHKIIIRRIDNFYQITSIYSDGTSETKNMYVRVVNGEQRFYENPDNLYGDYLVINENGKLGFYDNAGLIYELSPE